MKRANENIINMSLAILAAHSILLHIVDFCSIVVGLGKTGNSVIDTNKREYIFQMYKMTKNFGKEVRVSYDGSL